MFNSFTVLLVILLVGYVVILPILKNLPIVKEIKKKRAAANEEIKLSEKPDEISELKLQGYYRYQRDRQCVVERTPEQLKILNEYFIIKKEKFEQKWAKLAAIIAAIVGVVMILVGLVRGVFLDAGLKSKFCLVFGIICLAFAVVLFLFYKKTIKWEPKSVMTDEEYKRRVAEKIVAMRIADRALTKLGLDEEQVREIEPIVFSDKVVLPTSLRVYNPISKEVYSSTHEVTYVYFTDNQLFVYKTQFDMCCNVAQEWTSEYFYSDVCDVSSHVSQNVIAIGTSKIDYSRLYFEIIATNSSIRFELNGDNSCLASFMAMKQKIREKKRA